MKKLFLLLILSFFSAQGFAASCPDGSEPTKTVSADGTYFVYKCANDNQAYNRDDLFDPANFPTKLDPTRLDYGLPSVWGTVDPVTGKVRTIAETNEWVNKMREDKTLPQFIPENATLIKATRDFFGTGISPKATWVCNTGFKKSGDRCIRKFIPKNAHASGSSWACNTGYTKKGNNCIDVPANAYASGSSWACNTGYYKSGNSCIKIPDNAYLSGSSWKCNTGFTKDGNSCNKVEESMDYIEELNKIKELLDSGVINEEEFKKMKQKIIGKM